MSIQIEPITRDNDRELTAFLDDLSQDSPSVLAYHYPFYRDMLVELGVGKPHYLAAREGASIVGVLPTFEREAESGLVFSSLPFFGPNGGVLCPPAESLRVREALLTALFYEARTRRALSVSICSPFVCEDVSSYKALRPDVVVERFTQWTSVNGASWNNSVLRRNIRRAHKAGLSVIRNTCPKHIDDFYNIYSDNCIEYGIPLKPKEAIETLTEDPVLGRHTLIYFAMCGDRMVGGLLLLFSPATCSYYIPCTRDDARSLQPSSLLIDVAFRELNDRTVRFWNWESSPSRDSGVYKFKRKWNSQESRYTIYIWCPFGEGRLRALGRDRLATDFPHFFVYPYDQL